MPDGTSSRGLRALCAAGVPVHEPDTPSQYRLVVARSRRERDLLSSCDPEQIEAITTPARPLCVLAGAGSGKTRVLTRRMAWRVLEGSATADHLLALTFTRKAATQLRGRLSDLGLPQPVTAGTFHAVALSELKRRASERSLRPPVVLSSKVRLLYHVLGEQVRLKTPPREVAELATEIEWAKANCLTISGYERAVGRGAPDEQLADRGDRRDLAAIRAREGQAGRARLRGPAAAV